MGIVYEDLLLTDCTCFQLAILRSYDVFTRKITYNLSTHRLRSSMKRCLHVRLPRAQIHCSKALPADDFSTVPNQSVIIL